MIHKYLEHGIKGDVEDVEEEEEQDQKMLSQNL